MFMFVSQDGSNLPILPSQRAPNLYMVPQGIRPVVQLTAIEVCCSLRFVSQSNGCDYRTRMFRIRNGILLSPVFYRIWPMFEMFMEIEGLSEP